MLKSRRRFHHFDVVEFSSFLFPSARKTREEFALYSTSVSDSFINFFALYATLYRPLENKKFKLVIFFCEQIQNTFQNVQNFIAFALLYLNMIFFSIKNVKYFK
jgi:hypothetical protein